MKKSVLFLSAILTVAGCSSPAPESADAAAGLDVQAELAGIEQTRATFIEALRTRQYQNLGGIVTEDILTVAPGHPDWDRMYALNPEAPFPYDSIAMTPMETVLVNDSIAWDMGVSRVYFTNAAGEVEELRDTYLAILKKGSDGVWRLHREVASSRIP